MTLKMSIDVCTAVLTKALWGVSWRHLSFYSVIDDSELHWVQTHKKSFQNGKKKKKSLWPKIYFDVVVYVHESRSHDPPDHDLTYGFWVSIHFQTCIYTTLLTNSYISFYFKNHASKQNIDLNILWIFSHILWLGITFQVNFHRNTATNYQIWSILVQINSMLKSFVSAEILVYVRYSYSQTFKLFHRFKMYYLA